MLKKLFLSMAVVVVAFISGLILFAPKTALAAATYQYSQTAPGSSANEFEIICSDPKTPDCGARTDNNAQFVYQTGSNNPYTFVEYNGSNQPAVGGERIEVNASSPGTGILLKSGSSASQTISIGNTQVFTQAGGIETLWPPNSSGGGGNSGPTTFQVAATINWNGLVVSYQNQGQFSPGPIPITLTDSKGTVTTNNAAPNSATDQISSDTLTYNTSFSNVLAGQYTICAVVKPSSICQKVTASGGTTQVNLTGAGDSTTIPKTANGSSGSPDACAQNAGSFSWFICPLTTTLNDFFKTLYNGVIKPELQLSPLNTTSGSSDVYNVWKAFRDLGNVVFVLIFLVIILANVFSLNIDNYTVKKMLPRLVVAVIAVQFSFFICAFIVDIGNVLGNGIAGLINGVLAGSTSAVSGGTASTLDSIFQAGVLAGIVTTGFLATAAAIAIAGPTLLLLLLSLVLSAIALIITLVLRHVVIDVLVILSPIALAAWVLPNTEGLFKKWYQNFIKLVMMYPIVSVLLGGAAIVAKVGSGMSSSGGSSAAVNTVANPIGIFISMLAPTIAFFMIPMTLKWSGAAMGFVAGAVNSARGRANKVTQGQFAKDLKQGQRERNLMRSQGTGVTGFLGKVGAGGLGYKTAAGQRRLSSGYQKLLQDRGKEYEAEITEKGLNRDELRQLAQGQSVRGVKADDASQAKAIEMLAAQQDIEGLRSLRGLHDSGQISNAVWQAGISSNRNDLFQKAPDIVRPGNLAAREQASFDAVTAAQVANFHHTTMARYTQYLTNNPAARARNTAAVLRAFNTPQLANNMTPEALANLRNYAVDTNDAALLARLNATSPVDPNGHSTLAEIIPTGGGGGATGGGGGPTIVIPPPAPATPPAGPAAPLPPGPGPVVPPPPTQGGGVAPPPPAGGAGTSGP